MGELAVKYGFYSAEWDPKPHGTAFPMGEGTIVHYISAALISLPVRVCVCTFHSLSLSGFCGSSSKLLGFQVSPLSVRT